MSLWNDNFFQNTKEIISTISALESKKWSKLIDLYHQCIWFPFQVGLASQSYLYIFRYPLQHFGCPQWSQCLSPAPNATIPILPIPLHTPPCPLPTATRQSCSILLHHTLMPHTPGPLIPFDAIIPVFVNLIMCICAATVECLNIDISIFDFRYPLRHLGSPPWPQCLLQAPNVTNTTNTITPPCPPPNSNATWVRIEAAMVPYHRAQPWAVWDAAVHLDKERTLTAH